MEIFVWVVIGLIALSTLMSVASVNKPRKSLTPEVAAFVVLFQAAIIAGLIWVTTGL